MISGYINTIELTVRRFTAQFFFVCMPTILLSLFPGRKRSVPGPPGPPGPQGPPGSQGPAGINPK